MIYLCCPQQPINEDISVTQGLEVREHMLSRQELKVSRGEEGRDTETTQEKHTITISHYDTGYCVLFEVIMPITFQLAIHARIEYRPI